MSVRKQLPATFLVLILSLSLTVTSGWGKEPDAKAKKKVAAVVTVYHYNAHADVIVGRVLNGYKLDGEGGPQASVELAALYVDQFPSSDISRKLAAKHGVPIVDTIEAALTLGTGKLAVDGVLLIAEHGSYPSSKTGQTEYPKRRMFTEIVEVFKKSDRVVPVFNDKHLSDNWADAEWIYETSRALKIPLMAGSSLPSYRRVPETNVERGRPLKEVVAVGYGPIEAYGFHTLEMAQSLSERRAGNETGVRRVDCLTGDDVWEAERKQVFDTKVMEAALKRGAPNLDLKSAWRERVQNPAAFVVDHNDGLRSTIIMLSGVTGDFSVGWRYADDGQLDATLFALQNERPFTHFAYLLQGVEEMIHSGKPTWPVERTLLTTGVLHSAMISKTKGGKSIDTPHLDVRYRSDWDWKQVPEP